MNLQEYIDKLNRRFKLGNSTEHTFRGDLQYLIEDLIPNVSATNEPAGQKCGKPDYVLMRNDIPLGYIEAKDVGEKDLEGKKTNKKQFDRYKFALNNLIFTDYLSFHFYRDGEKSGEIVSIGKIENGSIIAIPENFTTFIDRIKDFCAVKGTQTIRSSKKLSAMMAGKARLLSNIIELALNSDETHHEDSTLKDQMEAFKDILIHDINAEAFADIYAQTITYGMFAARLHDPTLPTFSRQEAAELIPKSNPFLRKLFGYIAGPELDNRIKWIVDDLVEIFLACNVAEILKDYGKSTGMEDPIIHFYENFLSEYDPALRKARGVWYTPQPVVSFIVRAVDEILKTEFQLPQGLADTSKTTVNLQTQNYDKRTKKYIASTEEVHKVQILDPATGTGTFLAETIKHIHKQFAGQKGLWSNYVENHLLPRLNGFELLMASYAMAHLQLDLLLTETGYKPTKDQRFRVYLTNSLEEHHPDTSTLFANWLSSEANEANHIKRDNPVMIVMGNPPYAVSSNNASIDENGDRTWIGNLIADYKKNLNERKINLDDDYIKFIRFGQHYVDKNGEGILAYISNNSFIDGITHRQMRRHLLESFDSIYILDLHGNAKRKEVALDGSADQNVFDIMQGVSINLFVKTGKKKQTELGKVFHFDLRGKREFKYDSLNKSTFKTIQWTELKYSEPNLFFVPKNFDEIKNYEKGFKIDDIYLQNNTGIQTKRDGLVYNFSRDNLKNVIKDICELPNKIIQNKYGLPEDGRDWTIDFARKDLMKNDGFITEIAYHPFDNRYTYFTGRSKGFMAYPRSPISNNCSKNNISLLAVRNSRTDSIGNYFIANKLVDKDGVSPLDNCKFFPLYIYSETNDLFAKTERTPNLNQAIIDKIAEDLALKFTNEKEETKGSFAPIDILDYIYAVLHSPCYREKYKEFLKIDFPRVP